jgi:hypothetical protein
LEGISGDGYEPRFRHKQELSMFIGNDGGYFTILTISVKLKIDARATNWDLSSYE